MSEETKKPVTGSNEHFAEIEAQLGKLMEIETKLKAMTDAYTALVSSVHDLQNSVSVIIQRTESLERVNPAG